MSYDICMDVGSWLSIFVHLLTLFTSLNLCPFPPLNLLVFSGTKDKRGVTSQLMTAYRVEPSRLAGLNHK